MTIGPLDQKSLEWIDQAPCSATGRATTTATPEAVFAVLADHERWSEWFPGVKKVEVIGPAEGVGARRRVSVPGATFEEIFITWDPGKRWSFTGTGAKPRVLRALVEDCRLERQPDGSTVVTYSMYFEPAPLLRPLMKLVAGRMSRNLDTAMRALAARAEDR